MTTLHRLRALVAVAEEGSFTRAARREHATQSGISQHVAALEAELGVALLERGRNGARLTPAGRRYYRHAIEALRLLEHAAAEAAGEAAAVSGRLHVGLMPTFTRAALAPALARFTAAHPGVEVRITEAYSQPLTAQVRAGELDFAVVPASDDVFGLSTSLLARDREMLLSGPAMGLAPLAPVRLAALPPLKLVLPSRGNVRRQTVDAYCQAHGVKVAATMEMDAMLGTLEWIAQSDWVAVLPGLLCIADARPSAPRRVNPIASPALHTDYVVIEPGRRAMSRPAQLLLEALREEIARIDGAWHSLGRAAGRQRGATAGVVRRGAASRRASA